MYPHDNIFKIYYKSGRALPLEVRRFPDGRVSDWYKSQSVLVTKIRPRGEYGEAWGYYLRNGVREDSHWCKKDDVEPQPIPCCGCGGWVLVDIKGEPTVKPDDDMDSLKHDPYNKLAPDAVMTFGKYKGKTVAEVFAENVSYLVWAENNVRDFWIDWKALKMQPQNEPNTNSQDVPNNEI